MKKEYSKKIFNQTKILTFVLIVLFSFIKSPLLMGQRLNAGYTNEKLYAKDFKRSNGFFLKGKVNFEKGNFEKSEKLLKECLNIFPAHDQANYYLSILLYNQGKYEFAEKCISEAEKYFVLKVKIWENLYMDHMTQLKSERSILRGKMDSSEAEVRRIQDLNGRINDSGYKKETLPAGYPYIHGNIFLKLKKHKEAHGKYLEALKINPNHGKASNNIASLFYMIKNYDKALKYLNNAEKNGIKINPKFKEAINKALKK